MKKFLHRAKSRSESAAVALMQLVLLCNNFIFDNENYIQVKGTAMGTGAAPNYANLFMGDFEERFIYNTEWNTYLQYFGHYIDDIFMIWNGSEASLLEFVAYLNSVHETIKFTFKYSASQLEFLDVLVIKDSKGYLSTDVYQKDTDTHSYLHCHSAHPKHCKKSIPYSQFLRLKRICSEKDTLKKRIQQFTEYFANSGYSRKSLKRTANNVLHNSISSENNSKNNDDNSKYRLIVTHNELLPSFKDLALKHWPITQTNEKCRQYLNRKPQVAYRRSKNIKDYLVSTKYRTNSEGENRSGTRKCAKCSWCKNMTESTTFKSIVTGSTYQIYHDLKCTSSWVIYLCECIRHKKQYVGKSKEKLNIRMNNNRSHLRHGIHNCKLVQHFAESNDCNLEEHMLLQPIEQLKLRDDNSRSNSEKMDLLRKREVFWQ